MTNRPSAIVLMGRMFAAIFIIMFLISKIFNSLSGMTMFPLPGVIIASMMLTVICTVIGWVVVTGGMEALHGNDSEYKNWKAQGGRPYWDTLEWPINTATPIERLTGLAEPKYSNFVPPSSYRFQCPRCGARVEHQIDVCWNCGYGKDGNS